VFCVRLSGIPNETSLPTREKMATKDVAQELIQRHPLQRLESPSRGASALLHVSRSDILIQREHDK
jgi:hypothetical protein